MLHSYTHPVPCVSTAYPPLTPLTAPFFIQEDQPSGPGSPRLPSTTRSQEICCNYNRSNSPGTTALPHPRLLWCSPTSVFAPTDELPHASLKASTLHLHVHPPITSPRPLPIFPFPQHMHSPLPLPHAPLCTTAFSLPHWHHPPVLHGLPTSWKA